MVNASTPLTYLPEYEVWFCGWVLQLADQLHLGLRLEHLLPGPQDRSISLWTEQNLLLYTVLDMMHKIINVFFSGFKKMSNCFIFWGAICINLRPFLSVKLMEKSDINPYMASGASVAYRWQKCILLSEFCSNRVQGIEMKVGWQLIQFSIKDTGGWERVYNNI